MLHQALRGPRAVNQDTEETVKYARQHITFDTWNTIAEFA